LDQHGAEGIGKAVHAVVFPALWRGGARDPVQARSRAAPGSMRKRPPSTAVLWPSTGVD